MPPVCPRGGPNPEWTRGLSVDKYTLREAAVTCDHVTSVPIFSFVLVESTCTIQSVKDPLCRLNLHAICFAELSFQAPGPTLDKLVLDLTRQQAAQKESESEMRLKLIKTRSHTCPLSPKTRT